MKKQINLYREDLLVALKNLPWRTVEIDDFKNSSVTTDQINEADIVIFFDDDLQIVLKDRDRV